MSEKRARPAPPPLSPSPPSRNAPYKQHELDTVDIARRVMREQLPAMTVGAFDPLGAGATAAAAAITVHDAASDPHPQYLTQTEGDARYAAIASGSGHAFAYYMSP